MERDGPEGAGLQTLEPAAVDSAPHPGQVALMMVLVPMEFPRLILNLPPKWQLMESLRLQQPLRRLWDARVRTGPGWTAVG